jgi:putative transposase
MKNYAYKFRLFPTESQATLLDKHFGCVRFIYNHFLERRIKFYAENKEKTDHKKSLNYYDDAAALTKLKDEYEWLKEPNSQSLQHSLRCLESAYNGFFSKRTMFPKFKAKHKKQSFTIPQHVSVEDGKIYLVKFKEGIKYDNHRQVEGEIKHATVSKNKVGQYFVSILVERDIKPLPKIEKTVGIDLGLKHLAIQSDGKKYDNIRPYKTLFAQLKKLQQWFSRTEKGTKHREKLRKRIAKLYQRITNIRQDHLHKVSTKIVRENQTICLEDLAVRNLMKNHKVAGAFGDAAVSELVRMIEYKADWYGRTVQKIDRFFPSSKQCFDCLYINQELTLEDREWTCPRCGKHHDRDINAAKNIERQGLNLLNRGDHGVGSGRGSKTCELDVNLVQKRSSLKRETPSL